MTPVPGAAGLPPATAGKLAADHLSAAGRLSTEALSTVLTTLLANHPEARLVAIGGQGLFVPMPPSMVLGPRQRVIFEGTSVLELVHPDEMIKVLEAWELMMAEGAANAELRLLAAPDRTEQMHFIDATFDHGVYLGLFTGDTQETGDGGTVERAAIRPRLSVVRKDLRAVMLEIDVAFTRILGWSESEILGTRTLDIVHPDDQKRSVASWMDMLSRPSEQHRVQLRHRHRDGHWIWFEITNRNRTHDPEHGDVLAEMIDVTEEKAAEEALRASEELLRTLTQALPVGVLQVESDGRIRYRNPRLAEILGIPEATTADEQLGAVLEPDLTVARQWLAVALAGGEGDMEAGLADGRRCQLRLRPLAGPDGGAAGALICVVDVTEEARLREALRDRATYDALTRCLNRAATLDFLDEALATGSAASDGVAVVFLDIDHFKTINDRLGHAAGDELLVAVARRLRTAARHGDAVGRIGGDEFLMICRNVATPAEALQLAERMAAEVRLPLALGGDVFNPTASAGVAWAPPGSDAEALVNHADTVMYESKRERLGRPVLAEIQPYGRSSSD